MFVAGAYITVPAAAARSPASSPAPWCRRSSAAASSRGAKPRCASTSTPLLDDGADLIKVIATGAVLTAGTEPGQPEYSEAEIRAAVEEAAKRGNFVAAHAHGAEGIKRAVRAGVRSIEHGSLIDDEGIALMKEHGTWLDADIYNGDYIDTVGREQGWSAEILRKNDGDHRGPARRLPQGGQGRRAHRLRHRRRRLSVRRQRAPVRLHGALRA